MLRYSRQTMLPEVGVAGQQKLSRARILVVGVGGLGCPVLQYLVSAGIGTIDIMDHDRVDLSNLQRQILFTEADVGELKASVAVRHLARLNSTIQLSAIPEKLSIENAQSVISGVDLVMDCTDDLRTKYVLNDYCMRLNKPLISASVLRFSAQLVAYHPPKTPCMRCVFPPEPVMNIPSCLDSGILGAWVGMIGAMQALAAIRWAASDCWPFDGKLMQFNALTYELQSYHLATDPHCALCSGSMQSAVDYR